MFWGPLKTAEALKEDGASLCAVWTQKKGARRRGPLEESNGWEQPLESMAAVAGAAGVMVAAVVIIVATVTVIPLEVVSVP